MSLVCLESLVVVWHSGEHLSYDKFNNKENRYTLKDIKNVNPFTHRKNHNLKITRIRRNNDHCREINRWPILDIALQI